MNSSQLKSLNNSLQSIRNICYQPVKTFIEKYTKEDSEQILNYLHNKVTDLVLNDLKSFCNYSFTIQELQKEYNYGKLFVKYSTNTEEVKQLLCEVFTYDVILGNVNNLAKPLIVVAYNNSARYIEYCLCYYPECVTSPCTDYNFDRQRNNPAYLRSNSRNIDNIINKLKTISIFLDKKTLCRAIREIVKDNIEEYYYKNERLLALLIYDRPIIENTICIKNEVYNVQEVAIKVTDRIYLLQHTNYIFLIALDTAQIEEANKAYKELIEDAYEEEYQ
ncbi:MAG: hypothetical protein WBA17_01025 [Saprospiraceae bacterium]